MPKRTPPVLLVKETERACIKYKRAQRIFRWSLRVFPGSVRCHRPRELQQREAVASRDRPLRQRERQQVAGE
jgi:hypothetical protein